jgi:hypothetical protein
VRPDFCADLLGSEDWRISPDGRKEEFQPPNLLVYILFLRLLIIIFMRRTLVVEELLWQT